MSNVQPITSPITASAIQQNDQNIDSDLQATKTLVNNQAATLTSLQMSVNTNATNITSATNTANAAQTTANTASTNANNAVTTANSANTTALAAQSTANAASTTANTASTNANNAVTTANSASTTATAAQTTANTTQTNLTAHTTATSAAHPASAISETGNGDAQTAFNTIRNQVNTIVASGGTGGTEVVSARTSNPDAQAYTSVGQRLDMMDNYDNLLDAARADIVRKMVNSGVVDYVSSTTNTWGPQSGQVQVASPGTFMTTNLFDIGAFDAFVNGYKLRITGSNTYSYPPGIQLDAPPSSNVTPSLPSSGRDDLIFIEVWKAWVPVGGALYYYGGVSNGSTAASYAQYQWQWRFRVVDGVDFATYSEGIGNPNTNTANNMVAPQGGNASPLATPVSSSTYQFYGANARSQNNRTLSGDPDYGLYVAGDGSSGAKSTLSTADGYVYAIPLFRVRRRNSSAFDPDNNPLGGKQYYTVTVTSSGFSGPTQNATVTLGSTSSVQVGDYLMQGGNIYYQVTAINGTTATVNVLAAVGSGAGSFYPRSDRPDNLYSNIIDASDIMDLRHQVSLTGFNYQAIAEKAFDLLLRGQLTTNQTVRYGRDYIGLNLSSYTDDANTLLFANYDGASINGTANGASVTGTLSSGSASFVNGVRGLSFNPANGQYVTYPINLAAGTSTYSIEFAYKNVGALTYGNVYGGLVSLGTGTSTGAVAVYFRGGSFYVVVPNSAGTGYVYGYTSSTAIPLDSTSWHKALIQVNNSTLAIYVDGQSIPYSITYNSVPNTTNFALANAATTVTVNNCVFNGNGGNANIPIDSVRVSIVSRTESIVPTGFSYANGDRILDGPNADFAQWDDSMGGVAGVNGRTSPYGLSRVPNQIAARVNINGSEIRHYYGQGGTPGWTEQNTVYSNPTGSFDSSHEQITVNANEATGGTTYTFTIPSNAQGLFISRPTTGDISASNGATISGVSVDNTGKVTVVYSASQTSVPYVYYRTGGRHSHFIPVTKGFIVHDWTDDSLTANGTQTTFQTTKYSVSQTGQVRVSNLPAPASNPIPTAGGTGGTISTGTYYFALAWITPWGYSLASPQSSAVSVTFGQTVTFANVTLPSWATGVAVFASTTPGTVGALQASLTGQTGGASVAPPTVSAYVTNTLSGTNLGTGNIQNGGYSTQGVNAATTLSANAAQNATTITVTSATGFFANQAIRISNVSGGWYTTTITSIGGTTLTVPALGQALSQNATVQGVGQITFTTTPATLPSGATADVVYESVYTPSLTDYIRTMYQHTPYQGLLGTAWSGSGVYRFTFVDEDSGFITTLGSGASASVPPNRPGWLADYAVTSAQLPINGYDYQLKHDLITLSNNAVTGASQMFVMNEQLYEFNEGWAANIYSPLTADTPQTPTVRGYAGPGIHDGSHSNSPLPIAIAVRDLSSSIPHLFGISLIAIDNTTGECLLYVVTTLRTDARNFIDGQLSTQAIDVFKLPGRPFVKAYGGVSA